MFGDPSGGAADRGGDPSRAAARFRPRFPVLARGVAVALAASLALQLALLAAGARALLLGLLPAGGAGALAIQAVLAAWFGLALWRVRRR